MKSKHYFIVFFSLLLCLPFASSSYPQQNKKYTQKQKVAIDKVIKSLGKLHSAAQFGISYSLYEQKTVETKENVDEYMLNIPESALKDSLSSSMHSYDFALTLWRNYKESFIKTYNGEQCYNWCLKDSWSDGERSLANAEKIYDNKNKK